MRAGRFWPFAMFTHPIRSGGVAVGCALVALMGPSQASAQCAANEFCVNYDTANAADTGTTASTSLSWGHTVADGVNRALVVGVSIRKPALFAIPSVSSVVFAGQPLALLDGLSSSGGLKRAELWGLAGDGPTGVPTGTGTVDVTLTGSAEMVGGSVSFTGVDPGTSFIPTGQIGTGTTATNQLSSAGLTSMCVDVGAIEGDISATTLASLSDQVSRWNRNTGSGSSNLRGFGSTRPGQGTANTEMSWTLGSSTNWVTIATEVLPFASTSIRLASFDAEAFEWRGVDLRWRTGGEQGTLGFRVFREDPDGELVPVNRELVAGSSLMSRATLQAGYSYGWHDPSGKVGDRYWLEEVQTDGGSQRYGPYRAALGDRPIDDPRPSVTLSRVTTAASASAARPVPAHPAGAKSGIEGSLTQQYELADDPAAIKIGVATRGWYHVDGSTLAAAGLRAGADPSKLQLYTSGVEVPIRVRGATDGTFGAGDAIEFYGVGVDEEWTDTRVYWLIEGDEPGQRIETVVDGTVGSQVETLPYAVELRERLVYVASFANGDDTNFFGAVVAGDHPVERALRVADLDSDAAARPELELVLRGFSAGTHDVRVEVNGVFVADLTGADQDEMRLNIQIPARSLVDGENVVRLSPDTAGDITLVDVIRLRYPRRSVADDDELLISVPDDVDSFMVSGFTGPWVQVVDVSDPFRVRDLTVQGPRRGGGRVDPGGGSTATSGDPIDGPYDARFRLPDGAGRTIHAIGSSRVLQPAWIAANEPSSWSSTPNGADVLMIVARDLMPALQPLVAYRESQGHTVAVVAVGDAYDELSFGIKRPAAIRDLVIRAASAWSEPPEVLILVGDASYDPRNFLGFGSVDLVPTKFVATEAFEAASDDWFADVDGDGAADLVVGRLPVKTAAGLEALVSKTIAYEQSGVPWSEAMYVSDDDIGRQFEGSNARLMGLLPSLDAAEISVRELGNDAAQAAIFDGLDHGVNLVSYVGHGSVQTWSGGILSVDVLDQLAADAPPAVFTMMNCMNGYFFDAALDSLAEGLLKADGGAIAVFAPTGISGWASQEPMMAALYEVLEASTGGMSLGEAVAAAKLAAGSDDVRHTWVVLGDPMIHVR